MSQERNNELLLALQKGLPIEEQPFAAVGAELGLSEDEVITSIKSYFENGTARRLGGIFDARRLGYKSALCALISTLDNRDSLAGLVVPHPGVTHCYQRGWPQELDRSLPACPGDVSYPDLWFTLAVPADDFDAEVDAIRNASSPAELLVLPAIRRFKIDVIFDTTERAKGERFPGAAPVHTDETKEEFRTFTEQEKDIVRLMDGNLPLVPKPFEDLASQVGMDPADLLSLLKSWKQDGILRRIAMILIHHKVGFKANAMCLWSVPEDEALEAGRRLAANREVTHCYQRVVNPLFPYNLFAMIHTQNWEDTHGLFLKIADNAGLSDGKMLCSVKEYKKTSMNYFQ